MAEQGPLPIVGPDGEVLYYTYPSQAYGGGGGYGYSAPTENDQEAARILSAVVNENAANLKDTYAAQIQVYDIADQMSQFLATLRECQARRKAGQEWYLQQQKLQSTAHQLVDVAADALNSSLFYDFREMLSRVDDQADTEILKTLRENLQDIEMNLAEALMATINSRNDLAANTEQQLRQLMTDWIAQLNNIHPDLVGVAATSPTGSAVIDPAAPVPAPVNEPGWINYDTWFEDHDREAIKPDDVPITRPDRTAQMAWDTGRIVEVDEVEASSDPAYWNNIQDESERKTQ